MNITSIILVLVFLCAAAIKSHPVQLNNVDTLVFTQGAYTVAGRTKSVPMLSCIGGNACNTSKMPHSVSCKNIGINYQTNDPNWACTATLSGAKFGTTEVICEGYAHKDDRNVLAGSCSLEYTLLYDYAHAPHATTMSDITTNFLFVVVFGVFLALLLWEVYTYTPPPPRIINTNHSNPAQVVYATAYPIETACSSGIRPEYTPVVPSTAYGTTRRREESPVEHTVPSTACGTTTRREESPTVEVTPTQTISVGKTRRRG